MRSWRHNGGFGESNRWVKVQNGGSGSAEHNCYCMAHSLTEGDNDGAYIVLKKSLEYAFLSYRYTL